MNIQSSNWLRRPEQPGQRLWLDDIEREFQTGGQMNRLIRDDGIDGIGGGLYGYSS